MSDVTITPAMRFNAARVEQDADAGSLVERATRKAMHIESRPANYTALMLTWAEGIIAGLWNYAQPDSALAWDEIVTCMETADSLGWLA